MKNVRTRIRGFSAWQTSDGKIFESMADAQKHQYFINFMLFMESKGVEKSKAEFFELYLMTADFFGVNVFEDFKKLG
jgi:hypothetical protein